MRNRKTIIVCVALSLCIACFLSACGGPAGKIAKNTHTHYYYDTVPGEEVETEEEKEIKKAENNEKEKLAQEIEKLKQKYPKEMELFAEDEQSFAYTLIYAESCSNELSAEVKTFRSTAQKGLKADITAVYDTKAAETDKEFIIGNTNRTLSVTLLNKLKANRKNCRDDFIVYAKDGKIAIVGGSDDATIKGCKWFAETFCKSARTWTYLRDGYEIIYAPDYSVPQITISDASIYDFCIIIPKCAEYVYGRTVDDIVTNLRNNFHFEMQRDEERFLNADCEILVGNLDRTESKSVTPEENQYIIKVIGNKVVIKGYDSICLYYGVDAFNTLISLALKEGKDLNMPNGYELKKTVDFSNQSAYKLTFNDEFDGSTLNSMWSGYDGGINGTVSVLGGSILDKDGSLCYLKDGVLHMPSGRSGERDFYESNITLKNSLWYKYGCLEVCGKLPINPAHAAIWINGKAEIDILEDFGAENSFRSNIHKWFVQNTWDGSRIDAHTSLDGVSKYDNRKFGLDTDKYNGNLTDDFHVYSLDWTEDYFRFAVDGMTFFNYDYKENEDEVDFFKQELYLILNTGLGSNSFGAKYVPEKHDGRTYDFQVDYVRLYQNPSTDALIYK